MNITCKGGPPREKPTIYRGSTPTIILDVQNDDFDVRDIHVCRITVQSDDKKNKKQFVNPTIDVEEKTISFEMTQQDTLSFNYGNLNLQAKILLNNQRVVLSEILVLLVEETLDEDIIE